MLNIEFAIVSNLIFISRTNFMFIWVEHEIFFINLGLGAVVVWLAFRGTHNILLYFIWAASSEKCVRACAKCTDSHHSTRAQSHRHLLVIETVYSIQWFFLRTAKYLVRLHECTSLSGPSLSTYARKHVLAWQGPYIDIYNLFYDSPCDEMPKFSDYLTLYLTCSNNLLVVDISKNIPWLDDAFRGVWSASTLFAQDCQSKYWALIWCDICAQQNLRSDCMFLTVRFGQFYSACVPIRLNLRLIRYGVLASDYSVHCAPFEQGIWFSRIYPTVSNESVSGQRMPW